MLPLPRRSGARLKQPRGLLEVAVGVALTCAAPFGAATAQELNPRAYVITPTGTNVINIGYSHLEGGLDFEGAVPITGAKANINLAAFGYYHGFALLGRSANIAIALPYGVGNFSGTVLEAPKSARRSGLLDSSVRLSVNLLGGPAMEPREFVRWKQDVLLGASLKVVPPTGQYDPTLLINWGSNRWSFKPEIGYSQRWDHWLLDAYAGMWFFTENPEFFSHNMYFPGAQSQSESPVRALETHLSYDVRPRLWISLDANFWSGGVTSLNGVSNPATYQKNSRVGITASVPVTRHQSIKISYNQGAYINYGGNYKSITASWQYAWSGWGLRSGN